MFGFLKGDPAKKLRKQYEAKLAEAVERQRSGDIRGFAERTAEAEELERRLRELEDAPERGGRRAP